MRQEITHTEEIWRKALHLLALVVPLGIWILGRRPSIAILVPVASMAVVADFARSYWQPMEATVERYFGRYMRPTEKPLRARPVLNGATSILIGSALTVLFFPSRIAASTLGIFIIADAAAALVGQRFGRKKLFGGTATLAGSTAFAVTGIIAALVIPNVPLIVAIPVVFAATMLEALPLPANDNILVPFGSAAVMTALMSLQ